MTDRELLESAAKAMGERVPPRFYPDESAVLLSGQRWNPLTDDGDRYRLAQKLGLAIDFTECTVWKRLPDHSLIQEYWGGDCGDEAHAITSAAAAIGKEQSK